MRNAFLLIVLCLAILFSINAESREATPCTEWANFGKTVAYKYRDTGVTQAMVRKAVMSVMSNDPELLVALKYIDYGYDNKNMTASQVWLGVYEECRTAATL